MFKNITLIENDSTIYFWSFCELVQLIHKKTKTLKRITGSQIAEASLQLASQF